MKNRDIAVFSIDSLFTRKWTSAAVIAISTITMVILYYMLLMFFSETFSYDRANKLIKADKGRLANITVGSTMLYDETYYDRIPEFIDELDSLEGIELSGAHFTTFAVINELSQNEEYKKINGNVSDKLNLKKNPELSKFLVTDFDLLSILGISYDQKLYEEVLKSGRVPVLVGSAYKDIVKLHETLTTPKTDFEVIGFLDNSDRWFGAESISFDSENVMELDCVFMVPREYYPTSNDFLHSIFWYTDEKTEFEAAEERVDKLAMKHNIVLNSVCVKNIFDEVYLSMKETLTAMAGAIISVIVVTLFSCISSNIVSILFRKSELGIYQACGVTENELGKMILFESIIKTTASLLLGFYIGIKLFEESQYIIKGHMALINLKIFAVMASLGIVIILASALFPMRYIKKRKPKDFLEEYL